MERMKAEEERRRLEDKLQAEALRQQMEELKLKEMEVSAASWPPGLPLLLHVSVKWACTTRSQVAGGGDSGQCNQDGFSLLMCSHQRFSML